MNAYEKIEQALNLDKIAYIEDIFVTIRCGETTLNAILQPNSDFDGWVWNWDWWEGGPDVELIGAIPFSDIRINGNHLEYKED